MDAIENVAIELDSTFALMMETQKRGHEMLYALVDDLYQRGDQAHVMGRPVKVAPVPGRHFELGACQDIPLATVDVIWMRKDPPFDMNYIYATYILDQAAQNALVVNHPMGLRNFNEKAWALNFPDLIPESWITQSQDQLREFVERVDAIVVKPLDGNGGEGVFLLKKDDPNLGVILECSTKHGQQKVTAQRYVPEAKEGDKRIILVDGVAVGAFLRIPTGSDHRGNIHVGAKVVAAPLSERDLVICEAMGPMLKEAGQIFVGIDVIGEYLTEVNVTSPTGIHEINAFSGISVESLILDAVEKRLAA
jgi:glutathione synthase